MFLAAVALFVRPALANPPDIRVANASEQSAAWVPDPDHLVDIADEVASFSPEHFAHRAALDQASAEGCTLRGDEFSCRCVTLDTEAATFRARSWQKHGETVVASRLRVRFKDAVNAKQLYVDTWSFDGRHSLEGVVLTRALGQLRTLAARRLGLVNNEKLQIDELRWHRPAPGLREASCGAPWPEPMDEPSISAASATLDDGRWRFRGFQIEETTVYLPEFGGDSPGPVSGFLPPTLIYSDEVASLQASYLLADWGVAPQAVIAPTQWYGLGFGLMSSVEQDPDGPPALADETSLLDAQLRWSEPAGGVRPAVFGDGFWGSPYAHLSATIEEAGDRRFWAVDRFRQDAPFRLWRLSRAGVSLSGPTHVLRLQVLHTERLEFWDLLTAQPDPWRDLIGANLLLATHHELDEKSRADFEVEHSSLLDGDAAAHATTLRVGAERVVGSPGALYVRPALRAWLQTGLGSKPDDSGSTDAAESGLETSTRSQIVAMVGAGAALRGRFDAVTHRIEPGIVLARELVGFSRGDVFEDGESGVSVGSLVEREDGFSLGALRLDQELDVGPNLSFEMPIALVFEGAGFEEAVETKPWAIGGFGVRGPRGEVGLRGACPRLCDDVLWTASAAAEVGAFEFLYMGGDLRREALLPLSWRSSVHDGWALIHGFQQVQSDGSDDLPAQLAGVGWRRGRLGAHVRVYHAGSDYSGSDAVGVSLGNTYAFPELGWTVGFRATVGPENRDWGILVGLSPSG